MKIAVIGSTGRAGQRIYREALKRGHQVVGIARSEAAELRADLFELSPEDLAAFEVVLSAYGTWTDQSLHLQVAKHLDTLMANHPGRWIAVGGAGSLYVAPELKLMDSESFPDAYKPVARGMAEGLDYLKAQGKSNWSYFSPSAVFDAGDFTGSYRFGEEQLLTNSAGESTISFEDYASALLDVVEDGRYQRQRFTAVSEPIAHD